MPLAARIDDSTGCHGGSRACAASAVASAANDAQGIGVLLASGGELALSGIVLGASAFAKWASSCGKITEGAPSVIIEGRKAATLGHRDDHGRAVIEQGSSNVNICGRPAARIGDDSSCGGHIITSAKHTNIGGAPTGDAEADAAVILAAMKDREDQGPDKLSDYPQVAQLVSFENMYNDVVQGIKNHDPFKILMNPELLMIAGALTSRPEQPSPAFDMAEDALVQRRMVPNAAHGEKLRPGKTPEPSDSAEVFANARRGDDGNFYGVGKNGEVYRFSRNGDGSTDYHFNGMTGGSNGIRVDKIPIGVRRGFAIQSKGRR